MCGRYTLTSSPDKLTRDFGVKAADAARLVARFNIAPGQPVAAVAAGPSAGSRVLEHFAWGLIPPWSRDPSTDNRFINARSETVAEKPSFKASFFHRRCLLPASGYYEWKQEGGARRPYYLKPKSGGHLALAGIWSDWQDHKTGGQIFSCAILTRAADAGPRLVHDRMPVILQPEAWSTWLDPRISREGDLAELLKRRAQIDWEIQPVSLRVNDPRNDDIGCISVESAHPAS